MSGRHCAVKPRRRFGLGALLVPARLVWRWSRAGRAAAGRALRPLVERLGERFEDRDPFADVHLSPQATSPDPMPAPPAVEEPEPAPLSLSPDQVLPVLHTQCPHLPVAHVLWHVSDMGVTGEVNALEADASTRRQIVGMFADALAAPVAEGPDGEHVTVYASGEVGDVPVTVTAVLLHDDTIPLRVYRESASTQETQALPDELVEAVVAA